MSRLCSGRQWARLSMAAAVLLHASFPLPAAPGKRSTDTTGGPYCGIYSLYGALKIVGIDVDFKDLVDKKYVGAEHGSSLEELRQAASDFGASSRPVQGMTTATLRAARDPILLHVRRPGRETEFIHWVLFLGVDGEYARVLDPPGREEQLKLAELSALWDGIGLVVSREPRSMMSIAWPAYLDFVLLLVLAGVLIVGFGTGSTQRPNRGMPGLRGFAALMTTALVSGIGWHALHGQGFLRNRPALSLVVGRHFDASFELVDWDELLARRDDPDTTFIDARLPEDFAAGAVPGAINLPVISGISERSRRLANVPRGNRIIVYCQSEGCRWSDAVATDLVFRGFKRVGVFRGGYVDWRNHEQASERK